MSEKNPLENEDRMWQTHMQTLMRRKRNMEIAQTIDDALQEYYSERGLPVPEWKLKKDPQWWIDYLIELNIDPENP
jgi:dsRNA-specific ribonuclease